MVNLTVCGRSGICLLVFVVFVIGAAAPVLASPVRQPAGKIYKWQDENGVTHYSSQPRDGKASLADLPPIMRAEMKLPNTQLVTCEQHGGVNCGAGPDSDGSVICYDGFKGASARFRFTCTTPKLGISEIGEINQQRGFSVFLRNSKGVEAQKPKVVLELDDGRKVPLSGPDRVDAYGVAEFIYDASVFGALDDRPNPGKLTISCLNCTS